MAGEYTVKPERSSPVPHTIGALAIGLLGIATAGRSLEQITEEAPGPRARCRQTSATSLRSVRIRDTIDEEQVIDDRVCDCCSTSAAVTSAGPVVAYRDRTTDELRDPWLARRTQETWSEPRPVHADGWRIDGCPVNGPTVVAVEREGAVAWYTRADDRPSV